MNPQRQGQENRIKWETILAFLDPWDDAWTENKAIKPQEYKQKERFRTGNNPDA